MYKTESRVIVSHGIVTDNFLPRVSLPVLSRSGGGGGGGAGGWGGRDLGNEIDMRIVQDYFD